MAACALVYRWATVAFDINGVRVDLEYLVCDEDTQFRESDGTSVFFPPTSTVQQIKDAIGVAIRNRVQSFFGLTIPVNGIIMPEISKV